jgi:hypothetical protein
METNRWRVFAVWCAGICVIWVAFWVVGGKVVTSGLTFDDLFSSLGALFSGLAFAGVIYALRLQREELGLQREELRATREELRRTAAAQEATQTAMQEHVRIAAISALIEAAAKEGGQAGVFYNESTLDTFQSAVAELRVVAGLPARM